MADSATRSLSTVRSARICERNSSSLEVSIGATASSDTAEGLLEKLVDAFWHHPRDVRVVLRQAFFLGGSHPLGDPLLQFFDGIAADGELDQM